MMFVLAHFIISLVHISPTAFADTSQADRPPMSAFTRVLLATYLFEIGSYNSFLEAKRYAKLQHLLPEEMTEYKPVK